MLARCLRGRTPVNHASSESHKNAVRLDPLCSIEHRGTRRFSVILRTESLGLNPRGEKFAAVERLATARVCLSPDRGPWFQAAGLPGETHDSSIALWKRARRRKHEARTRPRVPPTVCHHSRVRASRGARLVQAEREIGKCATAVSLFPFFWFLYCSLVTSDSRLVPRVPQRLRPVIQRHEPSPAYRKKREYR